MQEESDWVSDSDSSSDSSTTTTTTTKMGCQSQSRRNLNARTRPRKTKKKKCRDRYQTTINGRRAFSSALHCRVCRAALRGIAKPHRSHHKRYKLNKKTRGMTGQALVDFQNAQLLKEHFAPLSAKEKGRGRHTALDGQRFFNPTPTTKKKKKNNNNNNKHNNSKRK